MHTKKKWNRPKNKFDIKGWRPVILHYKEMKYTKNNRLTDFDILL